MIGQINLDSNAGKAIEKISNLEKIKSIVEIGTWNGLGSTSCVISGIKNKKYCNFISLESDENFYKQALSNNLNNNVQIIYGSIVGEDCLDVDQLTGDEPIWLNEDIKNYSKCPNVLSSIPNKIDFLILDGGEFSTRGEFLALKDRSDIIFLDDTRIRKNNKNYNELINDNSFIVIEDHFNDRNGWAIFSRYEI